MNWRLLLISVALWLLIVGTVTVAFGATPEIAIVGPPNLTVDLEVYAVGSDTLVEEVASQTDQANRDGLYVISMGDTEAWSGQYYALLTLTDGTAIASGYVTMTDTDTTHYAGSYTLAVLDEDTTTIDIDSSISTTVTSVMETLGLDHLVFAAVTLADDVEDDSLFALILSKAATAAADTFNNQTDSLQAISDKQ